MALTPRPPAPDTNDPGTFDVRSDAILAWLATNVAEMDAFQAALTSIAAGTAFSIPYTFSTTTTDSDPGAGYLWLDNATQNAATTIRADLIGADGSTWTSVLDTFDDSTSAVTGQIMLVKLGDATKWLAFNVAALASPSGYKNITVANIASSAASPFADGDSLALKFTRTGDKGATGAAGVNGANGAAGVNGANGAQLILGTPIATTSGTAINYTGIPSGTKQINIHFVDVSLTVGSDMMIQIGDSGGIESSNYTSTVFKLNPVSGVRTGSHNSGFITENMTGPTGLVHGTISLYLENASSFTWTAGGILLSMSNSGVVVAGSKSLSAELDRIRITTPEGTSTFDSGQVNISYM